LVANDGDEPEPQFVCGNAIIHVRAKLAPNLATGFIAKQFSGGLGRRVPHCDFLMTIQEV
jgi:hypothetical protein